MTLNSELVALVQREREQQIRQHQLVRIATCIRECCSPTLVDRLARAVRGTPTAC